VTVRPDQDVYDFLLKCHPADSECFIDQCTTLFHLLEEYNSHTNLTRITGAAEYWSKHVADSLAISCFFPELRQQEFQMADIGCGAGFPSLILAIAFPQLQITAIDSIGKKTAFVQEAAIKLELTNLKVVTARSKEMTHQPQWQGVFDLITARAVADARTLFRESRAMLKNGGRFIFYKTPVQLEEDLPQVTAAASKHNIVWQTTPVFELPAGGGSRQFLYSQ